MTEVVYVYGSKRCPCGGRVAVVRPVAGLAYWQTVCQTCGSLGPFADRPAIVSAVSR